MDAEELLKAMTLVAHLERTQEKSKITKEKQTVVIRTTTKIMFIGETMTGAKLSKYLKQERDGK